MSRAGSERDICSAGELVVTFYHLVVVVHNNTQMPALHACGASVHKSRTQSSSVEALASRGPPGQRACHPHGPPGFPGDGRLLIDY